MSADEGAEAPSDAESDAEAPTEAPIGLEKVSGASKKRLVKQLLERLLVAAADAGLSAGKPLPNTSTIRSKEKVEAAALGSLVGLVLEIFQCKTYLQPRCIWGIVRELFPLSETGHWKTGAKTFLINVTVEKRECTVLDILTDLVAKNKGMAAALMDFGDSDEARRTCTRRVCKILAGFQTSTLVIAKPAATPKTKSTPSGSTGGSSSTPTTPKTPPRMALKSTVEELAAHNPAQVYRATALLGKNSSPVMRSKNLSPNTRKRFREHLSMVVEAVVAEVPKELPQGAIGPNALALLEHIATTGHKTLKADTARVKLQQRAVFEGEPKEAEVMAEVVGQEARRSRCGIVKRTRSVA